MDFCHCCGTVTSGMKTLLRFAVLLLAVSGVYSQVCTIFDQLPESQYDMTYSRITDFNKRPLGFEKATQYHSASSGPTKPCFSATGLGDGRQVELKYETVPSSTLCVRVKGGDAEDDYGCQEKLQVCRHAKKSTVEFEFYCAISEGCSESNVNFWVRVTTGPPPANDTEGMWCQWRNSKYPESLASRQGYLTPPTTQQTLGASSAYISLTFVLVLAVITCIWTQLS